MARLTLLEKLRVASLSFPSARGGNVALIFGLALVPLVGAVGAAVDYSRANAARTALQSSVDALALMLSKEAPTLTADQLTQKANAYFTALFDRPETRNVVLTSTFATPQAGSFSLNIQASADVGTTFTKIFGHDKVTISTGANVVWGMKRLEVALALDNTGSMTSSNKMTELKKAVKSLLATLQAAAKKPEDVKVAIVPFDTTVNIGTGYKNESWIDYSVNNIKKKSWEGCVIDRDKPNDTLDTTPSGSSSYFPAADCGSLVSMMPLTNDWTALNAKVDSMQPNGYTNVTIGLEWAWHALTPNLPLAEASAPADDLDKVIILLTDGDNTRNRWDNKASKIDPRTEAACANVKAANIKVYTVRVIDGNATLLRSCATSPSMYYDVQNASQLSAVFSAIAQNLANLRIAK